MQITKTDLAQVFQQKYRQNGPLGPAPKMWVRFGYTVPSDFYEAALAKLVRAGSAWLDVGCGRFIFPQNEPLARRLAGVCTILVGIDPDRNLEDNPFVHRRVRDTIENYRENQSFDVISLRMVAEHIENPDQAIAALARLTKRGGKVVIFTVNQWSPVSLLAKVLPFRLHHVIKRMFWGGEGKDTFPVVYKMNTRSRLARLFKAAGFREHYFQYLDDCSLFFRFPRLHGLELALWRVCRALGVKYPESCLLGIYERT